jgi:hypothetical protein
MTAYFNYCVQHFPSSSQVRTSFVNPLTWKNLVPKNYQWQFSRLGFANGFFSFSLNCNSDHYADILIIRFFRINRVIVCHHHIKILFCINDVMFKLSLMSILHFTFLFSLFVFVSAAGHFPFVRLFGVR